MPTIILNSTATTSWTVPADWANTSNKIATIGAGGNGDGGGGGGGAFSQISNLSLTPGAGVTVQIGSAGGGDTWFNSSAYASASVAAKGGQSAVGDAHGSGGSAGSGIGSVLKSGGDGGDRNGNGGGGGGGAGGFNGAGGPGATSGSTVIAGGGGGGAGGGNSGSVSPLADLGGSGGSNFSGTGGGSGGSGAASGSAGSNGGGGGGGGSLGDGGTGGASPSQGVFAGSGGGGGGGGGGGQGALGGTYGGGGGGGGVGGRAGRTGAIVIAYNPDFDWQYLPTLPNRRNSKANIARMASGLTFTATIITVSPIPSMGWRQWWSEPVRQRNGLRHYLQQSFINAVSQTLLPDLIRWYAPLSLPVRLPNGLKTQFQRDFTAPPRHLPASNITAVMSATEVNSDVATFGVDVYDEPAPEPGEPYAKVSIEEVPVEDSAGVSISEN